MQLYRGRPRYPKRRNMPGILVLAVLAALLLFGLTGISILFSSNSPSSGRDVQEQKNSLAANGIAELSAEEAYPQGALGETIRFDRLRLEKSKRRLSAFSGGKVVRVYLVALGANPVGPKEVRGDMRTPEGLYTINAKEPKSAYHLSLGISYPGTVDQRRASALGKSPGGAIMIHGLTPEYADIGQAHRLTDWTNGCVAVTNQEIEELFARTPVGASIEIVP